MSEIAAYGGYRILGTHSDKKWYVTILKDRSVRHKFTKDYEENDLNDILTEAFTWINKHPRSSYVKRFLK